MKKTLILVMMIFAVTALQRQGPGIKQASIFGNKTAPIPTYKPISIPRVIAGRTDATVYSSCQIAWADMIYWMALIYGDWYGNKGSNTVAYAYWSFLFSKAPAWINACLANV